MTRDQAVQLAVIITDGWPGNGASPAMWADKLEPLDPGTCGLIIDHLLNTEERPPAWARFYAEYRSRRPSKHQQFRQPCDRCDGTGWEQIEVHRNGYPHPTTGAVPCRCTNGKQTIDAHRRAVEHNDAELRRAANGTTVPA